ncbi:TBC domain-containing protein kinase-like protein [Araneus ventricosus]|uniref:TBC domain-containing protein kinase-like protein n=1 Tax=Araneus ventricosus TaxID=182803 RepID=A0A4Y2AHF7_ARAVE|nr:TBC domain-containing protein kinase-like protein [Araneus ventricosus]
MPNKTNAAVLGAWTFFASAHAIDVCGINGLPLTPNSIRILGRFQKLKSLYHPGLCTYLDIKRGKHERVMIVCEYYQDSVQDIKIKPMLKSLKMLANLAYESLDALSYLHSYDIIHRCLSPQNIRLDSEGHVKISNYGLYYVTECGTTVSFPIGRYMPNPLHCFQLLFENWLLLETHYVRCAEVSHDSAGCTAQEKCVKCKSYHTSTFLFLSYLEN